MARYKLVDRSPRFLPIVLDAQLMAGSFEYALDYLIDHEIDLSGIAKRYLNDETGAPAYDPAVMLKIVLLAYSRGVVSSRAIERLCRENVLFMAISGDSAPQFTTIAKFVRELGEEVSAIFSQVLLICDRQGLIGRQMFAIDGVKLSSNADKRRSGTHAELAHEAVRMEAAVARMLAAHRSRDEGKDTGEADALDTTRIERLQGEARRIREFLATHAERRSDKGAIRKSNVTDNDSAKMATSKGVIQGYTAVAAVDERAQIIVAAQTHGSGSEQSVLLPMVRMTDALRTDQTIVTADAGYHSEANLQALHAAAVPALIADGLMRRRDERFAEQGRYKALPDPLYDKASAAKPLEGQVSAERLHLRSSQPHLYLPRRQEALLHRQCLLHPRSQASQVPGRQTRLRALPPEGPMPTLSAKHPDASGGVLREEPELTASLHRAHEARDRQQPRPQALRATHRDRRARVRQSAPQQAPGPLHAAYAA